jgi:transcriptional regulator with XRE-family HTH domain
MDHTILFLMNNLREKRKLKGFTQEQLALAVGLSQGMISAHEKGKKSISDFNKLMEISRILECGLSDVVESNMKFSPQNLLAIMRTNMSHGINDPKKIRRIKHHLDMIAEELSDEDELS